MSYVLDFGDALRIVIAGVVALVGIGASIAWSPAARFDRMVIPARLFIAAGVATAVFDPTGVGAVLGAGLAGIGILMWWQTQPEPAVPRPQLLGVFLTAIVTGVVTLVVLNGWGAFNRVPEAGRGAAGVAVGAVGALSTLAVADRARIRLRDAIRRRFNPVDVTVLPLAGGIADDMMETPEDEPVIEIDPEATTSLPRLALGMRSESPSRAEPATDAVAGDAPSHDAASQHMPAEPPMESEETNDAAASGGGEAAADASDEDSGGKNGSSATAADAQDESEQTRDSPGRNQAHDQNPTKETSAPTKKPPAQRKPGATSGTNVSSNSAKADARK